jgi:nucleoside-diphosphate-sugar epimerase
VDESYPASPSNVYGLSKVLTEQMLDALTRREQFGRDCSAFSVRIPFILLPKWFDVSVTRTGQAEFMWGGSECFAYIERTDAADAFVRAVETPAQGHHIVWCAAPDLRSPEPVASVIDRFYASTPGADEARRRDSLQNCDKALALLGWRATRVLREERARRGITPPAGV